MPQNSASNCIKQTWMYLKREMNDIKIIGDFNTSLSAIVEHPDIKSIRKYWTCSTY